MELRTMRISTGDITGKKKGSASNDIFEKCRNFTRPSDLKSTGLYMYFEVFGDREGCGPGEVRMGRRKVLMFGSNDYLGLITHPKVIEAAAQAVRKYGTGCSGSRLLNGTLDLHVKLEAELAALVHKEAAIMFSTGFQGNYGTLSALTEKGDVMICDHNLHASLVEGALRSPAPCGSVITTWTTSSGAWRTARRMRRSSSFPKASSAWKATSPICAAP